MQKNKMMHIAFIGRLETEKGIEIVFEAIKRSLFEERNIIWHICGSGSYLAKLKSIDNPSVLVY
jgi:glycosyltransferase involved in cell wall biosynthesis